MSNKHIEHKQFTHASLFSGIGGPDLAAEWMGWENVFHCEINPFGQKILKYYWPNATLYENIKTTDFSIHRGTIDVLTGGFPCQPYSLAGLRKGKEDERHLWPEMLRAIREIKPRWVVGENVLGLVGWNEGLVFEEVQADLEAEGYEVQPYVLPAAGVDAPHQRYRVWFVAYASSYGSDGRGSVSDREQKDTTFGSSVLVETTRPCLQRVTSNSDSGSRRSICRHEACSWGEAEKYRLNRNTSSNEHASNPTSRGGKQDNRERNSRFSDEGSSGSNWVNWPTQPPICDGNDGLSSRLDGITFSKWRTESIKAGGNAIVPQVIHQIFKAIEQYETQNHTRRKAADH
jgi:DNA (cytosine-5)-methyltransferase 1